LVAIQAAGRHGWRTIGKAEADAAGVFRELLYTHHRHGRLRASVDGHPSPGFSLRHVKDHYVRPFGG
jgi:hypothetical protein